MKLMSYNELLKKGREIKKISDEMKNSGFSTEFALCAAELDEQGFDLEPYYTGYSEQQINQLIFGWRNGVDFTVYDDPKLQWEKMRTLRLALEAEFTMEEIDILKKIRGHKQMFYKYLSMKDEKNNDE